MAYLTPPDILSPYGGDQSYWQGYELIESDVDLTPEHHQTLVQTRLNELKSNVNVVQILDIQTRAYTDTLNPSKGDRYLTTINLSVIGDPTTYPLTP